MVIGCEISNNGEAEIEAEIAKISICQSETGGNKRNNAANNAMLLSRIISYCVQQLTLSSISINTNQLAAAAAEGENKRQSALNIWRKGGAWRSERRQQ